MPKKTKRQKIIAEYRRKLKQINQNQPPISFETKFKTPLVKKEPQVKKTIKELKQKELPTYKDKNENLKNETLFFKQDIKKSLVIIILILIIEFFLYLAKINNYISFF